MVMAATIKCFVLIVWSLLKVNHSLLYAFNLIIQCIVPDNWSTVMCSSIGTPKSYKFSICSKCKIIIFRCPKIWALYSLIIMCSNIGTPKNH